MILLWPFFKQFDAKELYQRNTFLLSNGNRRSFISLVQSVGLILFLNPIPKTDYAITKDRWNIHYQVFQSQKVYKHFHKNMGSGLTYGSSDSRTSAS